jgi:predicted acetyltransferase
MAEYRPVPDEFEADFREILNYAFRLHEGPLGPEADEHCYPSFGERRGLFEDGDLRCICRHYVLDARLRGDRYDVGGFTVIATPPEHRRQGYVSEITQKTLEEYRERDIAVSALWPFDYDFYRYFGWGTANRYARYVLPPGQLEFAADAESGAFRRLSPDDYERLEPVLAAHGADYELSIRRPEGWWRGRTFARHGRERFVYGWERDDELRGYLAYRVEPLERVNQRDKGETQLQVHDMAWTDREAYLNLLRFLYGHEAQVDSIRLDAPRDLDLLDLVSSPESVEYREKPGAMFRVVDVVEAIEMLDYPKDVAAADGTDGTFVLGITDEHAPWNDGSLAVEVADGTATCTPTDEAPDVAFDVARFSQLFVGARSLSSLVEAGHATVTDEAASRVLAEMFPESDIYLREYF